MDRPIERPVPAGDLGGTQIRSALISPDGAVHWRGADATRDEQGVVDASLNGLLPIANDDIRAAPVVGSYTSRTATAS